MKIRDLSKLSVNEDSKLCCTIMGVNGKYGLKKFIRKYTINDREGNKPNSLNNYKEYSPKNEGNYEN